MDYKKKLEHAINEFKPNVERFFGVNLKKIELKPKYDSNKKIYQNIKILFGGWIGSCNNNINNGLNSIIFYNNCRILDLIISQDYANYIAIHEMSHLAHKTIIGDSFNNFLNPLKEEIADYVAANILKKNKNFNLIELNFFGFNFFKNAKSLDKFLKDFKIDFNEYIKNPERYYKEWLY